MVNFFLIFVIICCVASLVAIGYFYLRKNQYLVGLSSFVFLLFAVILIFWGNIIALFPYSYKELGGDGLQEQAYKGMNQIRMATNRRWKVVSGYRDPQKNKNVGGATNSQHVQGLAFDVRVPMHRRAQFYSAANKAGFTAYGWGNNTVHIDMGPKRWWTYDNAGKAVSGAAKAQYLNKAPDNFKVDFGLE
ncbi:MAG: YcbK family protein [Alphaproteobacteria bacterium]